MDTASRSFQIRTVILITFMFVYALGALPVQSMLFRGYTQSYDNPLLILWGPYLFLFHMVNDEIFVRYVFVCLPFFGMVGAATYSSRLKYFFIFLGIGLLYYLVCGYAIWSSLPEVIDPESMIY